MDEQQTELENQQSKTENIETFDQSELNSENTVSAEPIMQKPIDTTEPAKKKKGGKLIIGLILVIIFAGLAVGAYLLFKDQFISLFTKYGAEVSLVSGSVEVSKVDGVWQELKTSDNVEQGNIVRVNGDGKAIISLDDGSAIRLGKDSRVKLTSLNPNSIEIANEAGEIYTRVVKADRSFVVKVADESYKSLGTAYKTVNTTDKVGVYVYESKVLSSLKNVEIAQGKKLFNKYVEDASIVGKILDIDNSEIESDNFVKWNRDIDLQNEEFKQKMGVLEQKVAEVKTETEPTPEPEPTQTQTQTQNNQTPAISLSGYATEDGIYVTWSKQYVSTPNGFKVVYNKTGSPVYPGSSYNYLSDSEASSDKIDLTDGGTYHIRVCQYLGGSCGVYSNEIVVTAPTVADGVVNSISLVSTGGANISWTVDGVSDDGFKVVWSKTANPVYSNRSGDKYHYNSSPSWSSDTITAFDEAGTYYVRVCEYLGGHCGVYSNEITVTL